MVVWWWPERWVSGVSGDGASRCYCRNPRSVGVLVGCLAHQSTSCCVPPAPTSLYRQCNRGPPTRVWLGAPDQGASQGSVRAVGLIRVEINPTFSPLISTLLLPFTLLVSSQIDT